jgi:hypothetical protein
MVVGLSAAALQGAPVVTQDVDLWFDDLNDPGIHQALREVGAAYVPPLHLKGPPDYTGPRGRACCRRGHQEPQKEEEPETKYTLTAREFQLCNTGSASPLKRSCVRSERAATPQSGSVSRRARQIGSRVGLQG